MHKTSEQISNNMRHVHSKDSNIEILLRRELWQRGLHYRKNCHNVFGCPDIAFIKKKVAIFCDSEFWHGYEWNKHKSDFKTHKRFWFDKIERNMERDLEVTMQLRDEGWTVLRFWGKEILKNPSHCADLVEGALKNEK